MTNKAQQRERMRRQERKVAMLRARRHKRNRQRVVVAVIVSLIVIGLIASFALTTDDDGDQATDVAAKNTQPTQPKDEAVTSAKGKPCVAVDDTLPQGAPAVPVKTGPPPAELIAEDLEEGTGPVVKDSDTLTVNYIGVSCTTGKIFDASYGGEPATFSLNGVIAGWKQGLPGMKVGGQRLLGIPSDLAYGPKGSPPAIAPDEALWFVVEVLEAKPA